MGRTFYTHNMFSLKLVLSVCILFFIGMEAAPKPKAEPEPKPGPWGHMNYPPYFPPYYPPYYHGPIYRGNRQITCGVDKDCYDNVCQTAAMCNAQHCWWGTPGIGINPAGTCYPKGGGGDYPGSQG